MQRFKTGMCLRVCESDQEWLEAVDRKAVIRTRLATLSEAASWSGFMNRDEFEFKHNTKAFEDF